MEEATVAEVMVEAKGAEERVVGMEAAEKVAATVAVDLAAVMAAEVKVAEEKVARSYSTDARRTTPRCRSGCRARPVLAAPLGTLRRPLPRRIRST